MKKRIMICVSVLLAVICLVGVFAAQSSKIVGENGLIAKARKEIANLAEVETIEMTIAGKSTIENNRHLFWIITGNEYQMHRYYPLEVIEVENGEYKFVHLERRRDSHLFRWRVKQISLGGSPISFQD